MQGEAIAAAMASPFHNLSNMTKATYLYIAVFALLFPLFSSGLNYSTTWQSVLCLTLIFVLGIPHGAADNVLYQARTAVSTPTFIGIYILTIGANIALWFFLPQLAYLVFIGISGYHFGQSQFSHYLKSEDWIAKLLYLTWGLLVLGGMIYFNRNEIMGYTRTYADLEKFAPYSGTLVLQIFIGIVGLGVFALQAFLVYQKRWRVESFIMETLVLGLLGLSFYVFPFLVSFTLYFVILHSFKVMREQYYYLRFKQLVAHWRSYLKIVLPFSLLSYAGITLVLWAVEFNWLPISYPYSFLILISSITVPHVYVMEQFYKGRGANYDELES